MCFLRVGVKLTNLWILGPGWGRGYSLVWILHCFCMKTGIDFLHLSLEFGMVFEELQERMNVFVVSIPNESERKDNTQIQNGLQEIVWLELWSAWALGPVSGKMIKFNPGLDQISSKVFSSENRQLEVTKYCWALTKRHSNDNTKCYPKQCIGRKIQKRNKILILD